MDENLLALQFQANSQNEMVAKVSLAAFLTKFELDDQQLDEIETVFSEAVHNAVLHAYPEESKGLITARIFVRKKLLFLMITDEGKGMFHTVQSKPAKPNQLGNGLSLMQQYTDELQVWSEPGKGTKIKMKKQLHSCPSLVYH